MGLWYGSIMLSCIDEISETPMFYFMDGYANVNVMNFKCASWTICDVYMWCIYVLFAGDMVTWHHWLPFWKSYLKRVLWKKTDSDFSLVEFVPCTRLNSPRCTTPESASKTSVRNHLQINEMEYY
jgi:hypothetical protein